jgi:hypothetical protein
MKYGFADESLNLGEKNHRLRVTSCELTEEIIAIITRDPRHRKHNAEHFSK